jgi:hypothetical protein
MYDCLWSARTYQLFEHFFHAQLNYVPTLERTILKPNDKKMVAESETGKGTPLRKKPFAVWQNIAK